MSRVFVGIPLSDELKDEIEKWNEQHKVFPVRWIQRKNLHITLVPPWKEKDVPMVLRKLEIFKNNSSNIHLKFSEVDFGTDKRSPRLIWALGEAPAELIEMRKQIYSVLGFEVPELRFLLHTTLAKFSPETFSDFSVKNLKEEVDWKMRVEKLVLFKSKLRAVGADYIPLGEVEV